MFLALVAVTAALVLARQWEAISGVAVDLSMWSLAAAFGLGTLYVLLTMLSWRAALRDLGSPLGFREAGDLFFVSQVAKYVPGSVWNVVAVAEMGTRHHTIPRRRSICAMALWWLVTIGTALTVAAITVPLFPQEATAKYGWLVVLLPVCVVALAPPVLNRIVRAVLRWTGQAPLDVCVSARGIASSALWAAGAWLAAGTQVWLIASSTGSASISPRMWALATAGFSVAWCVGFLFVPAPAGAGVREAALAAFLIPEVGTAAAVVTVLVSRLAITLADILLGAGALGVRRIVVRDRAASREEPRPEVGHTQNQLGRSDSSGPRG